jgi:hypothetical protein
MARKQKCGGELACKSIHGIALYTMEDGEKTYEHRCEECGQITHRPTVGGTCQRAAVGKVKR